MTLHDFVNLFVTDDTFRRAKVVDRPRHGLTFPDGTLSKQLLSVDGDNEWMTREVYGVEATTYEWEGHELPCLLIVLKRTRKGEGAGK